MNPSELEIASELKLSLEVPRQLNVCLDKKQLVEALHLFLFYEKYIFQNSSSAPFSWSFLTINSGQSTGDVVENMRNSVVAFCDELFQDFEASVEVI